jgi:hypothetical protein
MATGGAPPVSACAGGIRMALALAVWHAARRWSAALRRWPREQRAIHAIRISA